MFYKVEFELEMFKSFLLESELESVNFGEVESESGILKTWILSRE